MVPTDDEDARDLSAIVLTHAALITALFEVLQREGAVSRPAIDEVFDIAARGLDAGDKAGGDPVLIDRARRVLDRTMRNLAGPPRQA